MYIQCRDKKVIRTRYIYDRENPQNKSVLNLYIIYKVELHKRYDSSLVENKSRTIKREGLTEHIINSHSINSNF